MNESLNILTVNWTWYNSGGDWTYLDNVSRLYRSLGHNTIPFSMKSAKNFDAGGFEKYFVENIDYKALNKSKNISNGVRAISKSIYSFEAQKNLRRLLKEHSIQVAHLHNINHYLTPSLLPVLKEFGVKIIWTLHDYTLICPENSFISNDKICESCKGGKFFHCAIKRCKKKSFLASSLAALENYVHRYMNIFEYVDVFLCPSQFLFDKFSEFNFQKNKLVKLNNCFDFDEPSEDQVRENYILFAGRLAATKGIKTLIDAARDLDVDLFIAGDGPEKQALQQYIEDNRLKRVSLLGFKSKQEMQDLIRMAKMLVCPSEWYENFPSVVVEAMSLKTPVVGAAIGGIPELVVHNQTGLLFEAFNERDLRAKIIHMLSDENMRNTFAENAFRRTRQMVGFDQHTETLRSVFGGLGLSL